MDAGFDKAFKNKKAQNRPVEISAFDAGWIFKEEEGERFCEALSETKQISLFSIPLVKYLVIF